MVYVKMNKNKFNEFSYYIVVFGYIKLINSYRFCLYKILRVFGKFFSNLYIIIINIYSYMYIYFFL